MKEPVGVKVLIVNEHGEYLAGTAMHWEFTEDRTRARVFDYAKDRVPEQLELIQRLHQTVWIAVKLDPKEAYEFCDRCGTRMAATEAFFNGLQFVCQDCENSCDPAKPSG